VVLLQADLSGARFTVKDGDNKALVAPRGAEEYTRFVAPMARQAEEPN
jgi:hypothetical protein